MFQFFKTPFQQKLQIFTNFAVLEPKFTKISVPKPQILQNFSSKASNWAKIQFFKPYFFPKNQFFKPLFFVPDRSLSPHLRPSGSHTYTKMKVEYPRGLPVLMSTALYLTFARTACSDSSTLIYFAYWRDT